MEYYTVDYLKAASSVRQQAAKERERLGEMGKMCKLALKIHPGAMEHDRLPPRRLPEVRQRAV